MPRDRATLTAPCPKCGQPSVQCTHNHYQGETEIHAWEHRCTNCGHRQTKAFRGDDEPEDPPVTPERCPYCGRVSE